MAQRILPSPDKYSKRSFRLALADAQANLVELFTAYDDEPPSTPALYTGMWKYELRTAYNEIVASLEALDTLIVADGGDSMGLEAAEIVPISKLDLRTMANLAPELNAAFSASYGEAGIGGGTPEWLPEGFDPDTEQYADFAGGHFWVGGEEVAIGDVFSNTAGRIVPDVGLVVVAGAGGPVPLAIGALKNAFLTFNWTVRVEFEEANSAESARRLIQIFDTVDANNAVNVKTSGIDDYAGADYRDGTEHSDPDGTSIIAATRTDAKLASSVNGDAVDTDTVDAFAIPVGGLDYSVRIVDQSGGQPYFGATIRSIRLLPPADDADLPALSALPAPETPEWVPEGAVGYVDFVNDQYFAGGAEKTREDVVGDEEDESGSVFNDAYLDEDGYGSFAGEARGAFKNDLLADILSGCTLVYEFSVSALGDATYLISETFGLPGWETDYVFECGPAGYTKIRDFNGVNATLADAIIIGINRAALTMIPGDRLAMSLNGGTVSSHDPLPPPETLAVAYFLITFCKIRTIIAYDPADDADLPALSALA